jgi:hypothetical protein
MYRYSVDNAITYTSEDLVLFKESPFASFMERLTLENPDHGIPPDAGSEPPKNTRERQDGIAETLLAEGRDVALIDWEAEEPVRRSATLAAMRRGVDFIVNGQLALGPLSASANLLMRTSGYSELGDFLYMPCDTQAKTTLQSTFRLCFLADLLHSLQGQLPPQMLIIRGGSDVMPLDTENHIYHYRAVKQRFMKAQREFRKHRMPDPAESAHFGRWSECANEVLRQRALNAPVHDDAQDAPDDTTESLPLQRAVGSEQVSAIGQAAEPESAPGAGAESGKKLPGTFGKGLQVSDTLAAQARALAPTASPEGAATLQQIPGYASFDDTAGNSNPALGAGTEIPPLSLHETYTLDAMPTPIEPPAGRLGPFNRDVPGAELRGAAEAALDNLEFIGRGMSPAAAVPPDGVERRRPRRAPPATLGDAFLEPDPAEPVPGQAVSGPETAPHPLDSPGFNVNRRSLVDRDDAVPAASNTARPAPPPAALGRFDDTQADEDWLPGGPPFDSSLITNEDFEK